MLARTVLVGWAHLHVHVDARPIASFRCAAMGQAVRVEGVEGLRDRSSRPHSSPSQTPLATCTAVEALRCQRHTGKQIAAEVAVSPATVSRILRRLGLNRIRDIEPAEPERRYEREDPRRDHSH